MSGVRTKATPDSPEKVHPNQLITAVRTILNRTHNHPFNLALSAGLLKFSEYRFVTSTRDTPLSPLEIDLIQYLLEQGGKPVTRDELLVEVWGYRPGIPTRAIDQTINRLRAKIEVDRKQPDHLLTVRGVGYRFSLETPSDSHPRSATPIPSAPRARGAIAKEACLTNVPQTLDRFFGREEELQKLQAAYASNARLVTLHGVAGIGKTRLCFEFIHQVLDPYTCPGGVWLIDLTDVRSVEHVVRKIAKTLAILISPRESAIEHIRQIASVLRRRDAVVLIFDDSEATRHPVAQTISELLHTCASLRILATSREVLHCRGETVISVPPLSVSDSQALFVDRANLLTQCSIPCNQQSVIHDIATRLEGIPLAIELAAARTPLLSPTDLLHRLDNRFSVLRSPIAFTTSDHQTLRSALDRSWRHISPIEQDALVQCGFFDRAFSLEEAEATLDLSSYAHGHDIALVLQTLAEKSLLTIQWSSEGPGRRLILLDTIREYVREKLASRPFDLAKLDARYRSWREAQEAPSTSKAKSPSGP